MLLAWATEGDDKGITEETNGITYLQARYPRILTPGATSGDEQAVACLAKAIVKFTTTRFPEAGCSGDFRVLGSHISSDTIRYDG